MHVAERQERSNSLVSIYRTSIGSSRLTIEETFDAMNEECNKCSVETELEWRTMITLRDYQRIQDVWFKGRRNVYKQEYELRRFAKFQRRFGGTFFYSEYDYETLDDYARLNHIDLNELDGDFAPKASGSYEVFSEIKTTNCSDLLFYSKAPRPGLTLDGRKSVRNKNVTLINDNRWIKMFLFKRSLEMRDCYWCFRNFTEAENYQRDRSDNNLGALTVRKLCRFVECRREDDTNDATQSFRIALYSFHDEFQQIRHELAVEYEFDKDLDFGRTYVSPYDRNDETPTRIDPWIDACCAPSRSVLRYPETVVFRVAEKMAYLIDEICVPYCEYIERPMIQLNVDWLPNDAGVPNNNGHQNQRVEKCGVETGDRDNHAEHESASSNNIDETKPHDDEESLSTSGARSKPEQRLYDDELEDDSKFDSTDGESRFDGEDSSRSKNEQIDRRDTPTPASEIASSSRRRTETATTFRSKLETFDRNLSVNARILSVPLSVNDTFSLQSFLRMFETEIVSRWRRNDIMIRRKIDGVRLYATFDGHNTLVCENGETLTVDDDRASRFFSTAFVYQLERCDRAREPRNEERSSLNNSSANNYEKYADFVITEVVSVRNVYANHCNSLAYSFSTSVMPYNYTDDQQWPVGLDGTCLSPHETLSLISFWINAGCASAAKSKIVKRFIDDLRDMIRKDRANFAIPKISNVSNRKKKSAQSIRDNTIVAENNHTDRNDDNDDDTLRINLDKNDLSIASSEDSDNEETNDRPKDTEEDRKRNRGSLLTCRNCALASRYLVRNTSLASSFSYARGTNSNFINLDVSQSIRLLKRIQYEIDEDVSKTQRFTVNTPIESYRIVRNSKNGSNDADGSNASNEQAIERLMDEASRVYLNSIIRMTDILFLCGEHNACRDMLIKHLPTNLANELIDKYTSGSAIGSTIYSTPSTSEACRSADNAFPVDGFLVYVPQRFPLPRRRSNAQEKGLKNGAQFDCSDQQKCKPQAKSLCAIDNCPAASANESHYNNAIVFKVKPFHTIELVLLVAFDDVKGRGELHFCVKDGIIEQQNDLRSHSYLSVSFEVPRSNEDSNCFDRIKLHDHECSRFDGVDCKIYANPKVLLANERVYELLCYNEVTFFVLHERPDKAFPDTESKANGIVFRRSNLCETLNNICPQRYTLSRERN